MSSPEHFLESQSINKILHNFANATGLAVVLTDFDGREVSARFNFSEFCAKIRNTPDLYAKCKNSDRCGGLEASKLNKPCVYRCHAGLVDLSIPLIVGGHLVGFVLCGQVRVEDEVMLSNVSSTHTSASNLIWIEHARLTNDYDKIPVVNYSKILSAADLLKTLVEDSIKKHMNFNVLNEKYDIRTLFESHDRKHTQDNKIKKALRYLETHFTKNISLEDVADHVYLSPHYFSKLFKKEVQIGFNAYLNKQRMMSALNMLQYTDWSIAKIATQLGYSGASYFCKVFKNTYNTTPQEYRTSIHDPVNNSV